MTLIITCSLFVAGIAFLILAILGFRYAKDSSYGAYSVRRNILRQSRSFLLDGIVCCLASIAFFLGHFFF